MPAPSPAEYGKLLALGLISHYQINQQWFVQLGKVLVSGARYGVTKATGSSSSIHHIFTPDEVAYMLRASLMPNPQWLGLLQSKPNLPPKHYDLLTDAMSRHVAYDAYISITS